MIPVDLLDILRCPQTGLPLTVLGGEELADLNAQIAQAQGNVMFNQKGQAIKQPLEGGLMRSDRGAVYPLVGGIPVLLADMAISIPLR